MVFTHDVEIALQAAAYLANTLLDEAELNTVASLDQYFQEFEYTGTHRRTREELDMVRSLRQEIHDLLLAPRDKAAGMVNQMLARNNALPQLVRHDRLDWLKPLPSIDPMRDVLGIDDILRAQGYRRTSDGNQDGFWQADADSRASLTRKMGDEAERYDKFFGTLNRLADFALNEDGDRFQPRQSLDYAPGGRNAELLDDARRLGLIQWNNDTDIVFASREAAAYFRGGWLEEYVWYKLRGIRPHDWAVNLKTQSYAAQVENECDAAVVHRNRLLVIECKTSGFGKNEMRDVGYIYKLAQLADQIGGTMSQKLLLSARPIHDNIRQRAKEYRVDILAAHEVRRFVEYIKCWMQG